MAKEYKPGFVYIYSELLKQEVAMNKKTGKVYCEDKTVYGPEEMRKPHPCRTCREYECYDSKDYGTPYHSAYPFCTLRNEKAIERCGFYEQDKFSDSWEKDLADWERNCGTHA
jgi:hypothetical protein